MLLLYRADRTATPATCEAKRARGRTTSQPRSGCGRGGLLTILAEGALKSITEISPACTSSRNSTFGTRKKCAEACLCYRRGYLWSEILAVTSPEGGVCGTADVLERVHTAVLQYCIRKNKWTPAARLHHSSTMAGARLLIASLLYRITSHEVWWWTVKTISFHPHTEQPFRRPLSLGARLCLVLPPKSAKVVPNKGVRECSCVGLTHLDTIVGTHKRQNLPPRC